MRGHQAGIDHTRQETILICKTQPSREPSYATRAMGLFLFFGEERSTRCRKRRSLALPYMLLLMSFSRFTWPSRGPLLHGRLILQGQPLCLVGSFWQTTGTQATYS